MASGKGREKFDLGGFWGEVAEGIGERHLEEVLRLCTDPAHAVETLHWGRNYLYRVDLELGELALAVAVKQFRNQGPRAQLDRRIRGSKAERSWRMAWEFVKNGIDTAVPLAWIESRASGGPSFYVCRHLEDCVEIRYLMRARNRGLEEELYPWCDFDRLLRTVGGLARRMHDAGLLHRDLSIGNVLVRQSDGGHGAPSLWLLDLNRARAGVRPGVVRRARDICRLELLRSEDQASLLTGYWGQAVPSLASWVYHASRRAYRLKHQIKNKLKGSKKGPRSLMPSRIPHAHIEAAPDGAEVRDRVVWDPLTEQPHQHASRLDRLKVRLLDAPRHFAAATAVLGALPSIRREYRRLARQSSPPRAWQGVGVGLRPWPADPEALLREIEQLGVKHVLLRLHPWQGEHDAEQELAEELAGRGYELAFSLPQNRDLVRDPERWQASIEELGERFVPYGKSFQIGQAINRSKWGIWSYQEYLELASRAARVLRRHDGVRLLGPAVIDFEPHATAAALLLDEPELQFDGIASLLYVDRRGAPENLQLGLDAEGKARFMRAVAGVSPRCGTQSWITEYNWPLWEGPHSPAGKDVAVDEETQANYLVRYLMATLGSGEADRAYWWQLVAKGYGLVDPGGGGFRQRPAYRALAFLCQELSGTQAMGRLSLVTPARGVEFQPVDGGQLWVLWSIAGTVEIALPRPAREIRGRDGDPRSIDGTRVSLGPSPIYVALGD